MKISFLSPRAATLLSMVLLVPMFAACGSEPAASTPVAPTPGLPTAAPTAAAPTSAPVPTIGEIATAEPATAEPQPTTDSGTSGTTGTPNLEEPEFGVVNHLYYTDRERVLALNEIAGFNWVRQQVVWKDIEGPEPKQYLWGELENIIRDVDARGQKLLLSVVRAPAFYNPTNGLPTNPADMGDFVEALVTRYGDKIDAIEIWNEQNLAHENGGSVTIDSAGKYVEILIESYKRIKAVNPNIYVLAGAPSSSATNDPSLAVSDENYFRAMYEYNGGVIKDYFDAQAVHPGGAANPPETIWPDNPSIINGCEGVVPGSRPDKCWNDDSTHYFRHLEDIRRFMVEEGVGDKQMWITEYGWATQNNTPGYEFGNFVTFDQQAQYIVGAMQRINDDYRDEQGKPWVGVSFVWNMNFAVLWKTEGNELHEQASFGLLNGDWSPRPSFLAVQSYLAQVKQQRAE